MNIIRPNNISRRGFLRNMLGITTALILPSQGPLGSQIVIPDDVVKKTVWLELPFPVELRPRPIYSRDFMATFYSGALGIPYDSTPLANV